MVVDDNERRFRKFFKKLKRSDVRVIHILNEEDFFFYFHNKDNDIPDIIFLDHDLSIIDWDRNTKLIVKEIIKKKQMFANTLFVVHSLNDFGGAEIFTQLENSGLSTLRKKGAYEYVGWNKRGDGLTFDRIF